MTSDFAFTDTLNFSSLADFNADEVFNFTSFNQLQNAMATRNPAPPDFVAVNSSDTSRNCTIEAGAALEWMNADLAQTEVHLNSTKTSTVAMHRSLSMAEDDLTPLIGMIERLGLLSS